MINIIAILSNVLMIRPVSRKCSYILKNNIFLFIWIFKTIIIWYNSKHYFVVVFFSNVLQSSSSDIFVSWESFTDVEEYKKTVHKSGIKKYQVGVGRYNIVQIFRYHLFFLNVPVIFWLSSLGSLVYLLSKPF